ncbi:MAG: hypothetical protein M1817_003191 [Caeruleum heppii]|nr:MAG: hypothetical protein M1817_003191 [Caeruleum heppii]
MASAHQLSKRGELTGEDEHTRIQMKEREAAASETNEPIRCLNVLIASTMSLDPSLWSETLARHPELQHTNIRFRHLAHPISECTEGYSAYGAGHAQLPSQQLAGRRAPTSRSRVPQDSVILSDHGVGQHEADVLSKWADILILAPIEANGIAKMLCGMTGLPILHILRGWDVSKKIFLVPALSTCMWENPVTKKQLNKIRRKWPWIRVFPPVLWRALSEHVKTDDWEGYEELVEALKNQAALMNIGQDVDLSHQGQQSAMSLPLHGRVPLPPEIWSLILERVGDWETAKALGIYTKLSSPPEWRQPASQVEGVNQMRKLEWSILTGTLEHFRARLEAGPKPKWLSPLCVKLIIKFAATDLLSYLQSYHKDLFWATFGHSLLPTKASAFFGQVAVLEWWRTSPSFLTREYQTEAMDGASKANFVHVLEWWRTSGLPLRYSEAALEQASSKGNIAALDWWRSASSRTTGKAPLELKVGRSIVFAAQNGQEAVVRWWDQSGIPYTHEDSVAKMASERGHVSVLQCWKAMKAEKMLFDNQVLVGPTKNGHRDVLEWWRTSGYRVEYKTCDIEEALEDSLGGAGEEEVKTWWAENGLNLGVGTSEWMKSKVL